MIHPSFLVIGAAKSATTALHHVLSRHSQVALPSTKETNFFAFEGRAVDFRGPGDREALAASGLVRSVTTLEEYGSLFSVSGKHRAIGEICPLYLYDEHAPDNIRRHVPEVRLVAILRNPADRAFSAYKMLAEKGRERLAFERALDEEDARIAAHWEHAWHYVRMGRYHEQLARYYERFDRSRIRVYLHEDFEQRPDDVVRSICDFIGVDPALAPRVEGRQNVSRLPRSQVVDQTLRSDLVRAVARRFVPPQVRRTVGGMLHRINTTEADIPPASRARIVAAVRDDVRKLEQAIDRDLSSWLSV